MMRPAKRSSRSSSVSKRAPCPRGARFLPLDDARTIPPTACPAPSPSRPDDLDDLDASHAPPTPGGRIFMGNGFDCLIWRPHQIVGGAKGCPGQQECI